MAIVTIIAIYEKSGNFWVVDSRERDSMIRGGG